MRGQFYERPEGNGYEYTDLAVERRRANCTIPGVEYRMREADGGTWECIRISSDEGAASIGRPIGIYDTLNVGRMDSLTEDDIDDAIEEIAHKLCEIFDTVGILPERILVVGLGNRALTPDSVGPKAAQIIKPTLHISELDDDAFTMLECSEIAVITPGVMSESGMDSTEIIKGVCRRIVPDVILAIDSIATGSYERLGTTIQISDTGIFPGSGVGNTRMPLCRDTLGIPVIAIGTPTVIDSRAFMGTEYKKIPSMLVAPREIDEITTVAARIIGGAVNQAFGISLY